MVGEGMVGLEEEGIRMAGDSDASGRVSGGFLSVFVQHWEHLLMTDVNGLKIVTNCV